ncbi:MAG: YggS family pyridoxal phosphate-dependent enzyme [Candidatus Wallbacteria bacterium HGW-Wallbacteria-1]|jgi:hypothetical protein|uniref:Pyridoxal phosphate homeostasis protein n=1 Tax=Candidatus Wallbacteria bacterium HGW-Wallbacteria-1 TaxID=2013854 RepID=A0A2N1PR17_9BACT|nr:MAG: YggS family pyridoxal phosphate-dependent enzyme [Candidatus Wallbacteria bacterium HGW-Wallbacteria-1]
MTTGYPLEFTGNKCSDPDNCTPDSLCTVCRVFRIIKSLPPEIRLVAAAKTRTSAEAWAALSAGIRIIGHNYVQEALDMASTWPESGFQPEPIIFMNENAAQNSMKSISTESSTESSTEPCPQPSKNFFQWHLIGHLQRNKVKKALQIFHMIQSLDSLALAEEIDRQCSRMGRDIQVLIEINSGGENCKTGISPDRARDFISEVATLPRIQIMGLMTMGPAWMGGEELRPYFKLTHDLFTSLRQANLPGVRMVQLSMGMSDSYIQAIEEGATMVRIGTSLFGPRPPRSI